jgi:hypothetical protein
MEMRFFYVILLRYLLTNISMEYTINSTQQITQNKMVQSSNKDMKERRTADK